MEQAQGLMVEGGFGAGKSHLLEYLKYLALEQGFVCSVSCSEKRRRSTILPRYSRRLPKLLRPKMSLETRFKRSPHGFTLTGTTMLNLPGGRIELKQESACCLPRHSCSTSALAKRTPLEQIRNFWAGAKLPIADIRQGMKQIGQASAFQIRTYSREGIATSAISLRDAALSRGWLSWMGAALR